VDVLISNLPGRLLINDAIDVIGAIDLLKHTNIVLVSSRWSTRRVNAVLQRNLRRQMQAVIFCHDGEVGARSRSWTATNQKTISAVTAEHGGKAKVLQGTRKLEKYQAVKVGVNGEKRLAICRLGKGFLYAKSMATSVCYKLPPQNPHGVNVYSAELDTLFRIPILGSQ
jgi:hypothetical protein